MIHRDLTVNLTTKHSLDLAQGRKYCLSGIEDPPHYSVAIELTITQTEVANMKSFVECDNYNVRSM